MITPLGEGLGILITCTEDTNHLWMSFALWRSIKTHMPDATVAVAVKRNASFIYQWPHKCRVPFFQYSGSAIDIAKSRNMFLNLEMLELQPHMMVLQNYDIANLGPVPASSAQQTTFIDYSNGCGKFVPVRRIDRVSDPFSRAFKRFYTTELSVNETKILKYWESISESYKVVS